MGTKTVLIQPDHAPLPATGGAAPKNLLKPTQNYLNLSNFHKTPAKQCC